LPEQRGIAAWIMAYDTTRDDFHQALLRMTKDLSPSVRANAAVALDKFKDDGGHQCAVEMVSAPGATPDQQWEGLRALRVIGRREDLALTRRLESSADQRLRDAAKEATQGIDDRN
jgi:hypothetical protein